MSISEIAKTHPSLNAVGIDARLNGKHFGKEVYTTLGYGFEFSLSSYMLDTVQIIIDRINSDRVRVQSNGSRAFVYHPDRTKQVMIEEMKTELPRIHGVSYILYEISNGNGSKPTYSVRMHTTSIYKI